MYSTKGSHKTTWINTFSNNSAFSWNLVILGGPNLVILGGPSALVCCVNCSIPCGHFCVTFTGNTELLVDLCQRHGVLVVILNYPTCGE